MCVVQGGHQETKLDWRRINSAAARRKTNSEEHGGELETTPQDVKEVGGSERAAELKSEDRRLKKIRGGYI